MNALGFHDGMFLVTVDFDDYEAKYAKLSKGDVVILRRTRADTGEVELSAREYRPLIGRVEFHSRSTLPGYDKPAVYFETPGSVPSETDYEVIGVVAGAYRIQDLG